MEKLKFLREARNLSQTQLGKNLGISARRISSYEKGDVEPDIHTLIQIADYFNVDIDLLVGHTTDTFSRPSSEIDLSKFGQRLKECRLDRGIPAKELAQKAGITPQYLSLVEAGKIPSIKRIILLLNALDASADALFMDSLIEGTSRRARYLESRISKLPPEQQKLILNVMESMIETFEKRRNET